MLRGSEPIGQIGVRVYVLNVSTHVVLNVHEAQDVVALYPNGAICRKRLFLANRTNGPPRADLRAILAHRRRAAGRGPLFYPAGTAS
jgi:hypothetical protein